MLPGYLMSSNIKNGHLKRRLFFYQEDYCLIIRIVGRYGFIRYCCSTTKGIDTAKPLKIFARRRVHNIKKILIFGSCPL